MVQSLRAASEPFLDDETLFGFQVAMAEALTNIVRYSYDKAQDAVDGVVRISFQGEAAGISLEIHDYGKPGPAGLFKNLPKLDDIDPLSESGRGLALICHYAETVEFCADSTGNHLHLTFKNGHTSQL